MRIAVFVYGTRGDVQPMLALSIGLAEKGHQIVFIANPENEEMVKDFGFSFVPFGPNVKEQIRQNALMKRSPTKNSPSAMKEFKTYIGDQLNLLPDIIRGSDLILNAGLGMGVASAADIANVPYRFVIFYPTLLGPGSSATILKRMKVALMVFMANSILKSFINKKRLEAGLDPIKSVPDSYAGEHVIVAAEEALNKVNEGVKAKYTQTGYLFLPVKNKLPKKVEDFIVSGTPPVFIGFGSNPIYYPQELTQMFNRIAESTGQRLIVSKGWADLINSESSSDVLYVDDISYELLFPKMAAIIHHGGTGTMAYAARAGIPQAAFPFMADQFINRDQIFKLQIGPKTFDFKKMTEKEIVAAIRDCVSNDLYKRRAVEISEKIHEKDGLKLTVQLIEEEFNTTG